MPFAWSKTAEDIITRERRAPDALDHIRGSLCQYQMLTSEH